MGCDIHCHIEVKINGRWEHYSALDIDRDYSLFARMAGVRAYADPSPPIAKPRGLVPDPSIITEIDWARGDGDWHTPSWLTGAELDALIRERVDEAEALAASRDRGDSAAHARDSANRWRSWRRGGFGYLFGNDFTVKRSADSPSRFEHDEGDEYPDGIEDCRLVFWFDN